MNSSNVYSLFHSLLLHHHKRSRVFRKKPSCMFSDFREVLDPMSGNGHYHSSGCFSREDYRELILENSKAR